MLCQHFPANRNDSTSLKAVKIISRPNGDTRLIVQAFVPPSALAPSTSNNTFFPYPTQQQIKPLLQRQACNLVPAKYLNLDPNPPPSLRKNLRIRLPFQKQWPPRPTATSSAPHASPSKATSASSPLPGNKSAAVSGKRPPCRRRTRLSRHRCSTPTRWPSF